MAASHVNCRNCKREFTRETLCAIMLSGECPTCGITVSHNECNTAWEAVGAVEAEQEAAS